MDLLHHLFRSKGAGAADKAGESGKKAGADEAPGAVPNWRLEREETKLTRYTPFAPIAEAPPGDLVLLLEDVLPGVPTAALKTGLHLPDQRLCFSSDDLFTGLAKGRVTIALSVLAVRYPEIFEMPARPEDDVQVSLPLQKLIQQVVQIEKKREAPPETAPVQEAQFEEVKPTVAEAVRTPAPGAISHVEEAPSPNAAVVPEAMAPNEDEAAVHPVQTVDSVQITPAIVEAGLEEEPAIEIPAVEVIPLAPEAEKKPTLSAAQKPSEADLTSPPPDAAGITQPVLQAALPHLEPPALLHPAATLREVSSMGTPAQTPATPALEIRPPAPPRRPPAEPSAPKEPAMPGLAIPRPTAASAEPAAPMAAFRFAPVPPLIRAPTLNIPPPVQARAPEPPPSPSPPAAVPIPRPTFAPPEETAPPEARESPTPAPEAAPPADTAPLVEPEIAEPEVAKTTAPEPEPEPEPLLEEGQIATATIQEETAAPEDRFSLERIDQEPLQAIFMTDEQLDLPRISELSARLPGITGCLILAGETMSQGGERPSGLDALTLRELSRQLSDTVQNFKDKLPAEPMFTLYGGNRALSIFARGLVSLCVVHATRGFLPGVRERLNAVADTLAHGAEAGDGHE